MALLMVLTWFLSIGNSIEVKAPVGMQWKRNRLRLWIARIRLK
jgi:hypothetical protein